MAMANVLDAGYQYVSAIKGSANRSGQVQGGNQASRENISNPPINVNVTKSRSCNSQKPEMGEGEAEILKKTEHSSGSVPFDEALRRLVNTPPEHRTAIGRDIKPKKRKDSE